MKKIIGIFLLLVLILSTIALTGCGSSSSRSYREIGEDAMSKLENGQWDDMDDQEKDYMNDFLEWEEVYEGRYYGTLRSELDRIWANGKIVVFDVDVKGGINIKNMLKDQAFSIFVMPPSIEELRRRIEGRNTETKDTLEQRLARAEMEISMSDKFDKVILNDDLSLAVREVAQNIDNQLKKWGINR